MTTDMSAPVPASMQEPVYEDNLMGQAQCAFDEAKNKCDEIKGQVMDVAPDQCKQQ